MRKIKEFKYITLALASNKTVRSKQWQENQKVIDCLCVK